MLFPSSIVTAAHTATPAFVSICSQLAPPVSILLNAAPFPTIREIESNQDVGSLPLLPYSCMTANCCLWTTYGFLQRQASIWAPNLIGMLLALYYCASFIRFAPSKSSTLPGSIRWHVGSIVGVMLATITAVLIRINPVWIGRAAVLFCMALFASPLASLRTVLQTKSARSIPLPFTIASVTNCFLWSVTGILKLKDWNIIVPNVVGLACGLAQVGLKLIYGNHDPKSISETGYLLATP